MDVGFPELCRIAAHRSVERTTKLRARRNLLPGSDELSKFTWVLHQRTGVMVLSVARRLFGSRTPTCRIGTRHLSVPLRWRHDAPVLRASDGPDEYRWAQQPGPEVMTHLRAENAFAEAVLAPTEKFQGARACATARSPLPRAH
jgi:hypothetical protein